MKKEPKVRLLSRETGATTRWEAGELYLFHPSDARCPAEESVWAFSVNTTESHFRCESMTFDLVQFLYWQQMPLSTLYYRKANRAELRDYIYNLAQSECEMVRGSLWGGWW